MPDIEYFYSAHSAFAYLGSARLIEIARAADRRIVELVEPGDLVITADIPLAAEAIEKGADVFNPRGQAFTKENIRQRLAMRNFMEEMRSAGQVTGGPAPFSQTDRKEFADKLDRWLQRNARR